MLSVAKAKRKLKGYFFIVATPANPSAGEGLDA
jgi:hypothetical protein